MTCDPPVLTYHDSMATDVAELDARDPLANFAKEFYRPTGQIYLDGNSLGLLCKPAEKALQEAIESWKTRAILGWTDGESPWFTLSRRVAKSLAPILGAEPEDVMLGESTTVNLHQLLATFHDGKSAILIDEWCFPSDRYAIESHLRLRGQDPKQDLIVVPDSDDVIDELSIIDAMGSHVGFAVLPAVAYRTGQNLDIRYLTSEARKAGVLVAWDCSHSAGVVPHQFRQDDIDLAFGCTYKYLNGGPGSVGWLYVQPKLRERKPGLVGWFGSDPVRQFEMSPNFHEAPDAGRFMIGTPHVLSLAPLLGSLELIGRAGMNAIREKSLSMTNYLTRELTRLGLAEETPESTDHRGGHVTFSHPEAARLSLALRQRGVIVDHRPPDLVRLAPSPLYTSFQECETAIATLDEILRTDAHLQIGASHALVT